MRTGFVIGFAVGVVFVALGIYSIYYFLTVKQFMEHAAGDIYGNYAVAGLILIFFGSILIRLFYPIFIPLKANRFASSVRTCPFCGAIAKEDAKVCEKCKRQLE